MERKVELLAPAGDWEALKAAAANGADAVYLGLSEFNARHRAHNFTVDELPGVVAYLHERNVRVYVTLNTLIFSDELESVARTARAINEAGVDAVLVQDVGLLRMLGRMCPDLEVHASTQMTLTDGWSIEWARHQGVARVVLPRELSIHDIRRIAGMTELPLEVFIHGALCVAYSGQCLTSESIGGRSANRGQCAQACRLPYELYVDGRHVDLDGQSYLLSPQDLAGYEMVTDLVDVGVCSLKIEGRLKSAHYVAAATTVYRRALDKALAGEAFEPDEQDIEAMSQSFSRGFSPGFLDGINHQRLVQGYFPKHRGVRLGTVVDVSRRGVIIRLEASVRPPRPGDGVVFDQGHPEQDEQGGRLVAVTPWAAGPGRTGKGRSNRDGFLELVFLSGHVQLEAVEIGAIVWKTDDPKLERRLRQSWSSERIVHRRPLDARVVAEVGKPLRLSLKSADGIEAEVASSEPLEAAVRQPVDEAMVRAQLERLGDTPFELAGLELIAPAIESTSEAQGPGPARAMVPKSVLNELRRAAVGRLLAREASSPRAYVPGVPAALRAESAARVAESINRQEGEADGDDARLTVLVRTTDQLEQALSWRSRERVGRVQTVYCDFEDVRRYVDAVERGCREGVRIVLATPRIIKPGEEGLLSQVVRCRPDGVLIRNLSGLAWMRSQSPAMPLVGDFGLNLTNELTAGVLAGEGLVRMTPSHDLTWSQLAAMLKWVDPRWFEMVIHQHMPMFHMEHCIFAATLSEGKDYRDCGRPCDHHRVELADRAGVRNPLLADVGCRNTLFNGVAQSAAEYVPRMLGMGLRWFRIELLNESGRAVHELLDRYAPVLSGREAGRKLWRQLKVLSQVGLTRGTLDD
ncbi:MAG: U32 family peptidase [Phycisphaeraceae bacterium]|nr:U32 family peptidase [Phycisphaeraceae bacterium]